jgi:hypothetical protein
MTPYEPRAFRFLDLWNLGDWRVKAYGIKYRGELPRGDLIVAARAVIERRLRESAEGTNHYGVGFAGIHEGKTGSFVFVDWWSDENELHHHVYLSSWEEPTKLEYVTPRGLSACVWDLRLIWFEREAWVDAMLGAASAPDLNAYLEARLDEDS